MATKAKRHAHKYYRASLSIGRVWACALPDCNHFMPPHYTELVEGKSTICWNCEEPFTLDNERMKMDKPICPNCSPTMSDIIKESVVESFVKTPEERRAELIPEIVKCKRCNERPIMASESHGLCARCAISRFIS